MARNVTAAGAPLWHFLLVLVTLGIVATGLFRSGIIPGSNSPSAGNPVMTVPTATATATPTPTPAPTTTPRPSPTPTATVAPSPTTTPQPTSMAVIEVEWGPIGPAEADGLVAVSLDDDTGKLLHVVGRLPGKSVTTYYVWRTEDGGHTWERIGLFNDPEIQFKTKDWVMDFDIPFEPKQDPNNTSIIWKPVWLGPDEWEYHLSVDGGNSWSKLALPSFIEARGNQTLTDKVHFDLVSSERTLNLFLVYGTLLRGRISLSE